MEGLEGAKWAACVQLWVGVGGSCGGARKGRGGRAGGGSVMQRQPEGAEYPAADEIVKASPSLLTKRPAAG